MVFAEVDVRRLHRQRSPKQCGSSDDDAIPYLRELGIEIINNPRPMQFTSNINEYIHRWAPYVQGFSASFVQAVLQEYRADYGSNLVVMDPFAGCGTVLVQAKLNKLRSIGTELNPLLWFIADTKLNSWDVSPDYFLEIYNSLPQDKYCPAPSFLKSESHFSRGVLRNLERIKGGIEAIEETTQAQRKVKDLLRIAFSAILIDVSNLTRSPCLGYSKAKVVEDDAPIAFFDNKVREIAHDLTLIHMRYADCIHVESKVIHADAKKYEHTDRFDLIITSPPYMNGLDYVMNYKIEMGWLGFANTHRDLKQIKDLMVVCDNVSKGLIKQFRQSSSVYTNLWIEKIKEDIAHSIQRRGTYRRQDMPYIVHKYFDDMYRVMERVITTLNPGGRFILVVGDSLIADVYVPTDLLIARIGVDLGLEIEKIEKARTRRSGQIRSYKLRESIITLKKKGGDVKAKLQYIQPRLLRESTEWEWDCQYEDDWSS